MTNIGAVDDVEALFRALPLFSLVLGASGVVAAAWRFAFQREGTAGWLAARVILIVALIMLCLGYVYLAARHLRGRTYIQHTFIGCCSPWCN